jgi:Phosphotransferase enzyme family
MNATAERWTGGCRRELLDRTLVWNQNHLRRILSEYETHQPGSPRCITCTGAPSGPGCTFPRAVASHGDFQPRNWLWDAASSRLGVIDWERAEPAATVRDLVRLEYGPWDQRPDLREQFFAGYGRALTPGEDQMLSCHAVLDALSGLQWGLANGDGEVANRAWRTFERFRDAPLTHP